MVPNGTEWYQMVLFGSKWYPMVLIGNEWYQMITSDAKRYQIVLNGAEGCQRVLNDKSLLSFNLLHSVSWIKFVVTHSSDRCQLNSINTKLGLV